MRPIASKATPTPGVPRPLEEAARTVLARCDTLAAFSEEPGRLTRRFATPALWEAGEAVAGWMREAGLAVRRDPAGNVIARREGTDPAAGTLLLGSHLDTVRDAGRYDGALGVLVALAAVARCPAPPFALEVLAFADEEGVRYGTAYLGSAAVAGRFEPAWLGRRDAEGVLLADALRGFGGDPDGVLAAGAPPGPLLGYYEVHIEQGPVLEAEDLPVGVVTGIAGQTRARVTFTGRAGQAGTVPMGLRRDALCGAAELVLAAEALARESRGLVATVGEAAVEPGAANVIPGRAVLSLDVRHAEDATREAACRALRQRAVAIAAARGLDAAWEPVQATGAVRCSPALTAPLTEAVAEVAGRAQELVSGAGHDAAMLAAVAPVAMLFVRCAGGISHHPDEAVAPADVAAALDVSGRFLERLTAAAGEGPRAAPDPQEHA